MNRVVGTPAAGTPPALRAIRMRRALPADRMFAMSLVPHLAASSPVRWRHPRRVEAAYAEVIGSILEASGSPSVLLVGERSNAVPLGVALLAAASDCFTHARRGHLVQVAIAERPGRPGDGYGLLDAATAWARALGLTVLSPDAFWSQHPAGLLRARAAVGRPASLPFLRSDRDA